MRPVFRIPAFVGIFAVLALAQARAANLVREFWTSIPGASIGELTSNPNFPYRPNGFDYLPSLQGPRNWADNYGARVRGYLVPPQTGTYIFSLTGDHHVKLFLSADDQPINKKSIVEFTYSGIFIVKPVRKSAGIPLIQGKRYYFEVLHKEATGNDQFVVGWTLPSGSLENPIPNVRLEPFTSVTVSSSRNQVTEGSPEPTSIILRRIGDMSKPLTVNLVSGGTAKLGPDYLLAEQSSTPSILKSDLFKADDDAQSIANGKVKVTVPDTRGGSLEEYQAIDSWWRIKWKIARAYLLLGYESKGFPYGKVITAAEMKALDAKTYAMERILQRQSSRLGDFHSIASPDFWNNLNQDFIGGHLTTLFDLFNAGSLKYQAYNNECVLANYLPQMCGSLANFGTTSGAHCRSVGPDELLPPKLLKVQSPDVFGYSNRRDIIGANELPSYAMTFGGNTWATLVHEFTHDLDKTWEQDPGMHMVLDRKNVCSSEMMDFLRAGHPFHSILANGSQNPNDYVSGYASGLINPDQDYRYWEDVAESVTAYLLMPEYFRSRATASGILLAKYEYIRKAIFGGVEFENPEVEDMRTYDFQSGIVGDFWSFKIDRFVLEDIRVKGAPPKTYQVTFPAGKPEVRLDFLPMDESVLEGNEMATLELVASPYFQFDGQVRAAVTIANDD